MSFSACVKKPERNYGEWQDEANYNYSIPVILKCFREEVPGREMCFNFIFNLHIIKFPLWIYSSRSFVNCSVMLTTHTVKIQINSISQSHPPKKIPWCYCFLVKLLASGNHSSLLHPYSFVFSRMSYEWTQTVCLIRPFALFLSLSIVYLRFI